MPPECQRTSIPAAACARLPSGLNMARPSGIIPPRDTRRNSAIVDAAGWLLVACLPPALGSPRQGGAMIRLFRAHIGNGAPSPRQLILGALERDLMRILWASG